MSIAPAPTSTRGEIILQPAYFTSSIYVKPLRDDINHLILKYYEKYTETRPTQPFALFKQLWHAQGWMLLHFKVFDDRSRKAFLDVTLRLFLERTVKTEAPFSRTAALFGMYTFFSTQPKDTAPPLYTASHIPIPIDHYVSLQALTERLITPEFQPLQARVSWILSQLMREGVFLIIPEARLGALNPRSLPREVYMESCSTSTVDGGGPPKKGRPTKRDKAQKVKTALESLERTVNAADDGSWNTPRVAGQRLEEAMAEYQTQKAAYLGMVYGSDENMVMDIDMEREREVVAKANEIIVGRLRETQAAVGVGGEESAGGQAGLERAVRAAGESGGRGGVLGLLEGAGI